jgi:hypothetical protein
LWRCKLVDPKKGRFGERKALSNDMPSNYQDEQDSLGTRKGVVGKSPRVERRRVGIYIFLIKSWGKKTKTFGCDQTVVCKRVGKLSEWGN